MTSVSEDFKKAYEELFELLDRIVTEDISGDELHGQVNIWVGAHYRGGTTLSKAAVLALRSELARMGLITDLDSATERLRALQQIDEIVDPPNLSNAGLPVEVTLPPDSHHSHPQIRGFRMGQLQITAKQEPNGWHVSVSHPERYPTWEELVRAREVTGDRFLTLFAHMPAPGGDMGINRYIVHLYETIPENLQPYREEG